MSARIDQVVTSGHFTLDGNSWDVDNNVWVVGNDTECVVIDAAHDAAKILVAVGDRSLLAVLCTHAHNDHINAVSGLWEATKAPSALHPDDRPLWDQVYPDPPPDRVLEDGDVIHVAGIDLHVLHTPGHSPGAVCFYAPALSTVFSGDTLFNGGPGATGRSYSDFDTIIASIRDTLLALPPQTRVLTGHGEPTTIGDEAPHLHEWIDRGH